MPTISKGMPSYSFLKWNISRNTEAGTEMTLMEQGHTTTTAAHGPPAVVIRNTSSRGWTENERSV
jgi:hypothetical protein